MTRRTWTKEDDDTLRRMYEDPKVRVPDIAATLGISPAYVRVRAYRLRVKRPPVNLQERRKARRPRDRDDIASRLAVLLGQTPRPEAPRREFSDLELLRYAGQGFAQDALLALRERVWPEVTSLNPVAPDVAAVARLAGLEAYCREVVALELMDHQLAMAYLCLAWKRAVCLAGRQSGKDITIAALALWEALTAPNARVVMVSGAQRQSDALMEKILGFVARSRETFDAVASSNREELRFRNGSFVKALPATGLIRGETATRVLLNEARDVLNEEETYSAVEPMLLVTNGALAIFTTPLGKSGRVWEAFTSPLYLKTRIPSRVSKYATPEHMERQRLEMSAARYANEYEAEFLDVQSSFFSPESIARCARDYDVVMAPEPGHVYALGVDWARSRDTSAMVVVGRDAGDHLHVRYLRGFLGVPMPDQLAFVGHLHTTFAFRHIVSEYAGLGIGPTDQLVKQFGRVVDAFKPTAERKALGYDHLKSRLETGRVTIPMEPKLLAELRTLEFKVTPSGAMTIHHPGGGSDDYADALAIASWPFRPRRKGRPGFVAFPMPDPFASPEPMLRRRPPPLRAPTCADCGKPIEPGQAFLGADAQKHARCPPRTT